MPYKDPEKQKEYQRRWMADRRAQYVVECENCGATEDLELHHRDPTQKVSHRIWSWRLDRLLAELEKCIVLCTRCHEYEHLRTHCVNGHEFTWKNTYLYPRVRPDGKINIVRQCRTCHNERRP